MACSSPIYALITPFADGKNHLKIIPKRPDYSMSQLKSLYGDILALPCGSCPSCQVAKRKEWALRCEFESYYHKDNCFITLTYDDDHVPSSLKKSDLQHFIKSLRNRGIKFRYFACGEYGSSTARPHYHLIMFGYVPEDLKVHSKVKSGFYIYESPFLASIWSKGFVSVQDFDIATAAYTAGYVSKKLADGSRSGFLLMSKKPGIGEAYIRDHMEEIFSGYNPVVRGSNHIGSIPRYAQKLADKEGLNIADWKSERIELAQAITRDLMFKHSYHYIEESYKDFKHKLRKRGF